MSETMLAVVQNRSTGVRRYTVKEAVQQKVGAGERNMAEFDREWVAHIERTTRIETEQKQLIDLVKEVREAQEKRQAHAEMIERGLDALENTAWTGKKFRDSLPKVAAIGTITGLIAGLVLWLTKHLHL